MANSDFNATSSVGGLTANSNEGQPSTLGPTPSTAVAMIILYTITGIITALFLCIIITGAIRAHRHPERYGPRNLVGMPRQTRARGLARAMLDSLPIVKVGDRTHVRAKEADVELESAHIQATAEPEMASPSMAEVTVTVPRDPTAESPRESAPESGIAPALATAVPSHASPPEVSSQTGCSICTEDFEIGEDQRVLPCDHRFHPECIDPWLLNVSGTCPLCRIDLRSAADTESVSEVDTLAPPPPLDHAGNRSSRRRSVILSVIGVPRPERLSGEQRLTPLRSHRAEERLNLDAAAPQPPEEEEGEEGEDTGGGNRRRRGRSGRRSEIFRFRARRTADPPPLPPDERTSELRLTNATG